jgi:hypothetical protein
MEENMQERLGNLIEAREKQQTKQATALLR